MNLKKPNHTVDTIFIITLFLVFVLSAFFVLTIGADIYKNISDSIDRRFNETTSLSYISNKIKSYDERGKISISELDNIQALMLEQTIDKNDYVTMLYYHDEKLMELSCKKGEKFYPGDGSEVLDISGLEFSYKAPNLLQITVYNGNITNEIFICINCN